MLPERPRQVVEQRPQHVLDERPLTGFDVDVGRHDRGRMEITDLLLSILIVEPHTHDVRLMLERYGCLLLLLRLLFRDRISGSR